MANNENRDRIIRELIRIGKEYLLPIAKDAFYAYRDKILTAYNVPPEERAMLLDWGFESDPTTDAPPPPEPLPTTSRAPYTKALDPPIPDDAELLERGYKPGDKISPGNDGRWMVVRKGMPMLGAEVLRTIGGGE